MRGQQYDNNIVSEMSPFAAKVQCFIHTRIYLCACVRVYEPEEGTQFAGDDLVTTALGHNNDIAPAVSGRLALAYNRINLCGFRIDEHRTTRIVRTTARVPVSARLSIVK